MANHTNLTNEINKRVSGILSESVLNDLDNLDSSFRYAIKTIDTIKEFKDVYNRKTILFKDVRNDVQCISRETNINNYNISTNTNLYQGNYECTYFSTGNTYKKQWKDAIMEDPNTINIFCQEKISKELDKVINVEHTIYICIM